MSGLYTKTLISPKVAMTFELILSNTANESLYISASSDISKKIMKC